MEVPYILILIPGCISICLILKKMYTSKLNDDTFVNSLRKKYKFNLMSKYHEFMFNWYMKKS